GPGDGDRCAPAGAGRADPGPGHPLPQAVLPAPAGGLLRRGQDHPGHHPPGRGDRAHPHRRAVHPRRPDRAVGRDGAPGRTLLRGAGRRRPRRRGARPGPGRRTRPALRQERLPVRRPGAGARRRPRRGPYPRPGRPVRGPDERNLRMNALAANTAGNRWTRTFAWLLRREFWENRGGFLWAPVITGGIAVAMATLLALAGAVQARRQLGGGEAESIDDLGAYLRIVGAA